MYKVYDIKSNFSKKYLYLICNVKLNIQNENYKIINQHKNDICHVHSLEFFFTLAPMTPFIIFSPRLVLS